MSAESAFRENCGPDVRLNNIHLWKNGKVEFDVTYHGVRTGILLDPGPDDPQSSPTDEMLGRAAGERACMLADGRARIRRDIR